MSEQEKKSSAGADSSSVVVMEQTAGSRHKQPYRPTELQDPAPTLHHKRSKAPAVTSVAEELKNLSEDSSDDTKDNKECDLVMSSEKFKQNVAKKLSSSVKRRDSSPEARDPNKMLSSHSKRRESSPEAITLASVNVEVKKSSVPQTIPPEVVSVSSDAGMGIEKTKEEVGKSDDDSITEDIAELRTPEPATKHSEWDFEKQIDAKVADGKEIKETAAQIDLRGRTELDLKEKVPLHDMATSSVIIMKNKEVSWNSREYLQAIKLKEEGERSRAVLLERKSSLGPYRSRTTTSGASGIMICIPKKSSRNCEEDFDPIQSGINLTMSKKGLESQSTAANQQSTKASASETRAIKVDPYVPYLKYVAALRGKYVMARDKIKDVLNI